jgi:hypothetical protein
MAGTACFLEATGIRKFSKSFRLTQCGVGADAALGVHDLVDTAGRHVDRFGDPVLRDRFGYNNRALGLR